MSLDHADDLIDFALLNLIKEGSVEHTLLAHLHCCVLSGCHRGFMSDAWDRWLFVWLLDGRRDLSSTKGVRIGDNSSLHLLIFSEDWLCIGFLSSHCRLLFLGYRRLSLSDFAEARGRISVRIFGTL